MPWGVSFQSTITAFLAANNSASRELTAQTIASLYHADAQLASPTLIPGSTPLTLPGPSGIQAGFLASFNAAFAITEGQVGQVPDSIWLPAASSVVTYWTGVQFNPLVPAPGGLLGVTSTVLYPGDASALASQLGVAFKAGLPAVSAFQAASLVAAALNGAFVSHLAQVSGTWIGTAPGAPPVPYTFPWVGIT